MESLSSEKNNFHEIEEEEEKNWATHDLDQSLIRV